MPFKVYSLDNDNGIFNTIYRLKMLLYIIKKENIGLILSFSSHGALLAILSKIFFPLNRIKVIVRMGSPFNNLFQDSRASKTKNKIGKFISKYFIYKFVDKIICTTNYMKKELLLVNHRFNRKISIIRNFSNEGIIKKLANEKIEFYDNFILYAGRLEEEKNVKGIITAFNQINKDFDIKLLLIGDGSFYNSIKEHITELSLNDSVIMLGYEKNPYKFISRAKFLVLFSNYEGSPNVILESKICGTPVISSDFNGVDDFIKDMETGLIVSKNNENQLAGKMRLLLGNSSLRKSIMTNSSDTLENSVISIREYESLIKKQMRW